MKLWKLKSPTHRAELALFCGSVLLLLTALLPLSFASQAPPGRPPVPSGKPLTGGSMWIWYMPKTQQEMNSLISRLKAASIKTVLVKSADGTNVWRQFNKQTVDQFHQAGFHVCAWHYVYGAKPLQEAEASSKAYQAGAECMIIDAEAEYANRGKQAAQYIQKLRSLTSRKWLLGLSSFPYTNYHSDFPYQVFLAPGAAEVNLSQMYWKDIGVSPAQVVSDTYARNQALGRPVYPAGQTWKDPDPAEIKEFLAAVRRTGAPGWSWWDSNQTTQRGWQAIKG